MLLARQMVFCKEYAMLGGVRTQILEIPFFVRAVICQITLVLVLVTGLGAQETAPDARAALKAVADSISQIQAEIEQTNERIPDSTGPEKERLQEELKALDARLELLRRDFTRIATGINSSDALDAKTGGEFNLARELNELLMPIIRELKEATRAPREIEETRADLSDAKERRAVITRALERLEAQGITEEDTELYPLFQKEKEKWDGFAVETDNRIKVLQFQLDEMMDRQKSVFDTATHGMRGFVKTRGKNLLYTILTFVGVFALLRYLHGHLHRISPWHRPGKRSFYARLVDVLYYVFSFVGALAAAMLVLYTSGDWVLLGIAIILLIGIALAAKNGLPRFYHDGRLLLNLGEVREGERVVYRGLPWKVESLTFFSKLVNPALKGGVLRMPVAALGDLISRPHGDDEPWFPCEVNDWVRLDDGTVGEVVVQTPEMVQMILLGGSRKTYTVAEFLATSPEDISGHFRLRTRFGIDHKHRAISTSEVPEVLERTIRSELCEIIEEDQIESLSVEFLEAGRSSLDYEVLADLRGDAAPKFEKLQRLLQRACVNACNANDWTIPFTQVALHNAAAVDA